MNEPIPPPPKPGEIPVQNIQDYSGYTDFTETNDPNTVYNKTEIVRRLIEPENEIREREFNRNLQLGNIERGDVMILEHRWEVSKLLKFIPENNGAFLFSEVGQLLENTINFHTVITNSVDGWGRKAGMTQIRKEEFKDTTTRGMSSYFSKPTEQK